MRQCRLQVLILLRRLQRELGMGMIFVTHDLGVASEIADTIAVMYAGRIVESGPVAQILSAPGHPYTTGLLASTVHGQPRDRDIDAIPGSPPDPRRLAQGCSFAPRCPRRMAECRVVVPQPRAFPHPAAWPRVMRSPTACRQTRSRRHRACRGCARSLRLISRHLIAGALRSGSRRWPDAQNSRNKAPADTLVASERFSNRPRLFWRRMGCSAVAGVDRSARGLAEVPCERRPVFIPCRGPKTACGSCAGYRPNQHPCSKSARRKCLEMHLAKNFSETYAVQHD